MPRCRCSFDALHSFTRVATLILAVVLAMVPLAAQGVSSSTTRVDWGSKAPLPTRRVALGVAAAPNGKLYAIGGGTPGITRRVEEYNPATNTWRSQPEGVAQLPADRADLAVATAPNGKLYAVGGVAAACGTCPTLEEYDPVGNAWVTKASMSTPRYLLAMATATNGTLYAVGGIGPSCPGPGNICATLEEYDPAAGP